MVLVNHVVLLHASPDANKENIAKICQSILDLKSNCKKDGKNYIKSIQGGADKSIEGLQAGITHAFIVQFESQEDRDYYVKEDAAHKAVGDSMMATVGVDLVTAQVVDFTPDAF